MKTVISKAALVCWQTWRELIIGMSDLGSAGERAAAAGPCLSTKVDEARDAAAVLSMAWAVSLVGGGRPAASVESPQVTERYRSIVRRWLRVLWSAGWVDEKATRWLATPPSLDDLDRAWETAVGRAPEPGAGGDLTRFFSRCARSLPELLSGDIRLQSLLFEESGASEEIYQANEASRYTNAVAAAALRQHCGALLAGTGGDDDGRQRTPVILEIGGGVGGTTDIVLDDIKDLPARYHFTDVGEWFTVRAQERWAGRSGLTTGLYDINDNDSGCRQSLGDLIGRVDVILAANVMHNARNVVHSLSFLADISRPGARLVLIETGTEHLPLLISMRFLMEPPPPAPGIGGDRGEQDRILLTSEQWTEAIGQAGWTLLETLPGPDSGLSVARYDQHTWVAENLKACSGDNGRYRE